jgi:hypothetical protein
MKIQYEKKGDRRPIDQGSVIASAKRLATKHETRS